MSVFVNFGIKLGLDLGEIVFRFIENWALRSKWGIRRRNFGILLD